jgi:predicted DCC family thiol-disulfide oxidoreductase YuxK
MPDMSSASPKVTVLYDGACPLCRREIGVYQRARGADGISWQDVSPADAAPGCISRDEAMRRFHVIDAEGRIRSGADAFIALWLSLPGWRWIGRFASVPPLPWLLERAYRSFLVIRPVIQRVAARRST